MKHTTLAKTATSIALCTFVATLTVSGQSEGDNRGAAGGALVGLTMGALTGDASLAAKGAIAGGVAGGVAGSMSDLESDRDSERTATMADAIAGKPSNAGAVEQTRPQTWSRLDGMIGDWNCAIWGLDEHGKRVTAASVWKGELASTKSIKLNLIEFDAEQFGDDVDAEFGGGYSQISYDADKGYEILNVFSRTPDPQRWVGERLSGEERYSFYYVGGGQTALGNSRIEMRFIGTDMFLVQTMVSDGSGEKQVQEYRFTRR